MNIFLEKFDEYVELFDREGKTVDIFREAKPNKLDQKRVDHFFTRLVEINKIKNLSTHLEPQYRSIFTNYKINNKLNKHFRNTYINASETTWDTSTSILIPENMVVIVMEDDIFERNNIDFDYVEPSALITFMVFLIFFEDDSYTDASDILTNNSRNIGSITTKQFQKYKMKSRLSQLKNASISPPLGKSKDDVTDHLKELKAMQNKLSIYVPGQVMPDIEIEFNKRNPLQGIYDWTQYLDMVIKRNVNKDDLSIKEFKKDENPFPGIISKVFPEQKNHRGHLSGVLDFMLQHTTKLGIGAPLEIIVIQKKKENPGYPRNIISFQPSAYPQTEPKNVLNKFNNIKMHFKDSQGIQQVVGIDKQFFKRDSVYQRIFKKLCFYINYKKSLYVLLYDDIYKNENIYDPFLMDLDFPVKYIFGDKIVDIFFEKTLGKVKPDIPSNFQVSKNIAGFTFTQICRHFRNLNYADLYNKHNMPWLKIGSQGELETIFDTWKNGIQSYISNKVNNEIYFEIMQHSLLKGEVTEEIIREIIKKYTNDEESRKYHEKIFMDFLNDKPKGFDNPKGFMLFWIDNDKSNLKKLIAKNNSQEFWDKYKYRDIVRDMSFPYLTPAEYILANFAFEKDSSTDDNKTLKWKYRKYKDINNEIQKGVQTVVVANNKLLSSKKEYYTVDYRKAIYIYNGLNNLVVDYFVNQLNLGNSYIKDIFTAYIATVFMKNQLDMYNEKVKNQISKDKIFLFPGTFILVLNSILDDVISTTKKLDKETGAKIVHHIAHVKKNQYFDFSQYSEGKISQLTQEVINVIQQFDGRKSIWQSFYDGTITCIPEYINISYLLKNLRGNYISMRTDKVIFYYLFPIKNDIDTLLQMFSYDFSVYFALNSKVDTFKVHNNQMMLVADQKQSTELSEEKKNIIYKYFYMILTYLDYYGLEFNYWMFTNRRIKDNYDLIQPIYEYSFVESPNKKPNKDGILNLFDELRDDIPIDKIYFCRFLISMYQNGFGAISSSIVKQLRTKIIPYYNNLRSRSAFGSDSSFQDNDYSSFQDKDYTLVSRYRINEFLDYLNTELNGQGNAPDNFSFLEMLEKKRNSSSLFKSFLLDFYKQYL